MIALKKILIKELKDVGEEGYVLVLGGYELQGYIMIKGNVFQGDNLILMGSIAIEKDRYQEMTQQRSVSCPECRIAISIPKIQEKFVCPNCKKEWTLQLSEEDKKFSEFKNWNIGFTFWAEEQTLRDKVGDFLASIPEKIKEKPEALVGSSGLLGYILKGFGK